MKYNADDGTHSISVNVQQFRIVGCQILIRALTSDMLQIDFGAIVRNDDRDTCKLVRRETPLSTAVLRIR